MIINSHTDRCFLPFSSIRLVYIYDAIPVKKASEIERGEDTILVQTRQVKVPRAAGFAPTQVAPLDGRLPVPRLCS